MPDFTLAAQPEINETAARQCHSIRLVERIGAAWRERMHDRAARLCRQGEGRGAATSACTRKDAGGLRQERDAGHRHWLVSGVGERRGPRPARDAGSIEPEVELQGRWNE